MSGLDGKRVTTRLDLPVATALDERTRTDGISVSDRLAALVSIWHDDQSLQQRTDRAARELAQQRRDRRYGRESTPT